MNSLFEMFIQDSIKGKRLQRDGHKIKAQTVENYYHVLKALEDFQVETKEELVVTSLRSLSKRKLTIQTRYWKKFYRKFREFLYKRGCHDNYVGSIFKILRAFFGYLNRDRFMTTGDFYKRFYLQKEEIPVLTLNPLQLHFLITDKYFENSLPEHLRRTKDIL